MKLREIEKRKRAAKVAQQTLRACWVLICNAEKVYDTAAGKGWFAYGRREGVDSIAGEALAILDNDEDAAKWAKAHRKALRAELDEERADAGDEEEAEEAIEGAAVDGTAQTDLRAVNAVEALALELRKKMADIRRIGAKAEWPSKIIDTLVERVSDDEMNLDRVVARWVAPFDAAVMMARALEAHCPLGIEDDEYREAVRELLFDDEDE